MKRSHIFIHKALLVIIVTSVILLCLCVISLSGCSTADPPQPEAQTGGFPAGELSPYTEQPGWLYAGDSVPMRAFSHPDAPVTRTLSQRVVRVLASAWWTEAWVLVYSPEPAQSVGALGWVPLSELCKFTSAEEQPVTYPVRLRSDAADLDTGKPVALRDGTFPQQNLWITFQPDGSAVVYCEGGNLWHVAASDLLFPSLTDGVLSFADGSVTDG